MFQNFWLPEIGLSNFQQALETPGGASAFPWGKIGYPKVISVHLICRNRKASSVQAWPPCQSVPPWIVLCLKPLPPQFQSPLNCPRSPKLNLLRNSSAVSMLSHVFMIFFILFAAIILSRGISALSRRRRTVGQQADWVQRQKGLQKTMRTRLPLHQDRWMEAFDFQRYQWKKLLFVINAVPHYPTEASVGPECVGLPPAGRCGAPLPRCSRSLSHQTIWPHIIAH